MGVFRSAQYVFSERLRVASRRLNVKQQLVRGRTVVGEGYVLGVTDSILHGSTPSRVPDRRLAGRASCHLRRSEWLRNGYFLLPAAPACVISGEGSGRIFLFREGACALPSLLNSHGQRIAPTRSADFNRPGVDCSAHSKSLAVRRMQFCDTAQRGETWQSRNQNERAHSWAQRPRTT
jgi:hypothetical protein